MNEILKTDVIVRFRYCCNSIVVGHHANRDELVVEESVLKPPAAAADAGQESIHRTVGARRPC